MKHHNGITLTCFVILAVALLITILGSAMRPSLFRLVPFPWAGPQSAALGTFRLLFCLYLKCWSDCLTLCLDFVYSFSRNPDDLPFPELAYLHEKFESLLCTMLQDSGVETFSRVHHCHFRFVYYPADYVSDVAVEGL